MCHHLEPANKHPLISHSFNSTENLSHPPPQHIERNQNFESSTLQQLFNMASIETPKLVDTTPISPTRGAVERRNSLEKHLQHRPEADDLKARNILLNTDAAPYVNCSPIEAYFQLLSNH